MGRHYLKLKFSFFSVGTAKRTSFLFDKCYSGCQSLFRPLIGPKYSVDTIPLPPRLRDADNYVSWTFFILWALRSG
jgi:hypothetical protein